MGRKALTEAYQIPMVSGPKRGWEGQSSETGCLRARTYRQTSSPSIASCSSVLAKRPGHQSLHRWCKPATSAFLQQEEGPLVSPSVITARRNSSLWGSFLTLNSLNLKKAKRPWSQTVPSENSYSSALVRVIPRAKLSITKAPLSDRVISFRMQ